MRQLVSVVVVALFALTARAELPAGEYTVSVDEDNGLRLPQGTFNDLCQGSVCVDSNVTTDVTGAITGTATVFQAGPLAVDLLLDLQGQLSGTTTSPKAKFTFTATGTAAGPATGGQEPDLLDLEGDGKMSCRFFAANPARLRCDGKLRVCAFRDDVLLDCSRRLRFRSALRLEKTPLELNLELATDAQNRVTGTAEVEVGTRPAFACSATGKYAEKTDRTSLRLESADPRAKISLQKAELEDDTATSATVVFQVAGQKGKARLLTEVPPP